MNKYTFDCGCQVNILDDEIKEKDGLPSLEIPYEDIAVSLNYQKGCDQTWNMLGEGKTKGVFQLESGLGKSWAEKLKPNSVEEMSALISIIRPGVLNAMLDGKSLTQHYIDRKFKREESLAPYKALEQCGLDSTYFILVYQESMMRIFKEIAGFNDADVDKARKGCGKKDAELLFSLQQQFMDGCEQVGLVSKDEAKDIFDWIKAGARYSFNKSHGIAYGIDGYLTAFAKYHFPLHFFCAWLKFAKYRQHYQKETRDLIAEAKDFDISIQTPSIDYILQEHDISIYKDHIKFGFNSIKKVGEAALTKFIGEIQEKEKELGKPIKEWTWYEFLINVAPNVTSTAINGLICGGVLDKYGYSRNQMLYDYEIVRKLTEKQLSIARSASSLQEGLVLVEEKVNKGQKKKIGDLRKLKDNPPSSLSDSISWILVQEKELYGVPLTYNPIDVLKHGTNADTTCKEFADGKEGDMTLGVEIEAVRLYKIKNGKNKGRQMAYLQVSDGTATIDSVIFSEKYSTYKNILYPGNLVFLSGFKSDKGSFLINKVDELF